jgi:hypothetical protein
VLRGWASPGLLATYEPERRPVAARNVRRSSEPAGASHETGQALAWDLGGRLPHHWLANGQGRTSTIDLIGDGLTLLSGLSDPRWGRFAESLPSTVPVDDMRHLPADSGSVDLTHAAEPFCNPAIKKPLLSPNSSKRTIT